MSETQHLKCPCCHCGSSIEFPAHGIGMSINCPHCSGKTTLFAPPTVSPVAAVEAAAESAAHEAPIEPQLDEVAGVDASGNPPEGTGNSPAVKAGRSRRNVWVVLGLVLVLGLVGMLLARRTKPTGSNSADGKNAGAMPPSTVSGSTNPAPPEAGSPPGGTKATRSIDDLKVGPINIEKSKGSSLVYAFGVLRNASDFQRFGVTIELDLADTSGKKVGTSKDYRNVLEPRQEWRFRALVLDSKAVSATVARIREEE